MFCVHDNRGFTLLETVLALIISSAVMVGITAFFDPSARVFQDILGTEDIRLKVSSAMDSLEKELSGMRALYVDSNQCYALCVVDSTGERVFYYWGGPEGGTRHLYRKKEPTSNPISCSGGQAFATNLETSLTTFAMTGNLLTVNLGAKDVNDRPHRVTNVVFPSVQERDHIFSEGFECATLRNGWSITNGANTGWSLQGSANLGYYRVAQTSSSDGSDSSTLEVPVDLSRISSAHLLFSYMNDGTISVPDSFLVEIYNGSSWQTVYSDSSALSISSPKTIDADLSGYALSSANKIRFTGSLKNSGSHWYVDGVSVYNP